MPVDTSMIDYKNLYEQEAVVNLGNPVRSNGKTLHKGSCFVCGGNDRMAVFVDEGKQGFYCGINKGNGCDRGWDAISFLQELHHCSFSEALERLTVYGLPVDGAEIQIARERKPAQPKEDKAP